MWPHFEELLEDQRWLDEDSMEKTLDLVNDPDVKQKLLEKVRECCEGVSTVLATVLRAITVYASHA